MFGLHMRLAPKVAACFIASPPQDGFAVANLAQHPRIQHAQKTPALKAQFTSRVASIHMHA
ncbi:MAG: hypothetical protein DME33_09025 [Verrucomicrobia bacterium]|nr:MAG: hypothetical protein DME33_09025 [Verrucomicrobiota bacterium]